MSEEKKTREGKGRGRKQGRTARAEHDVQRRLRAVLEERLGGVEAHQVQQPGGEVRGVPGVQVDQQHARVERGRAPVGQPVPSQQPLGGGGAAHVAAERAGRGGCVNRPERGAPQVRLPQRPQGALHHAVRVQVDDPAHGGRQQGVQEEAVVVGGRGQLPPRARVQGRVDRGRRGQRHVDDCHRAARRGRAQVGRGGRQGGGCDATPWRLLSGPAARPRARAPARRRAAAAAEEAGEEGVAERRGGDPPRGEAVAGCGGGRRKGPQQAARPHQVLAAAARRLRVRGERDV